MDKNEIDKVFEEYGLGDIDAGFDEVDDPNQLRVIADVFRDGASAMDMAARLLEEKDEINGETVKESMEEAFEKHGLLH